MNELWPQAEANVYGACGNDASAHRRGFTIPGHCSWPPIVPLPRNRLAASATGGASAVPPPRTPLKRLKGGGCGPFLWILPPRGWGSGSGARSADCPQPP